MILQGAWSRYPTRGVPRGAAMSSPHCSSAPFWRLPVTPLRSQVHRFLAVHTGGGHRGLRRHGSGHRPIPRCANSARARPRCPEAAFRANSQALLAPTARCGRCIAIDSPEVAKGAARPLDHFADPRAAQRLGALAQTEQLILAHLPSPDHSNEIPTAAAHRGADSRAACDPGCRALSKTLKRGRPATICWCRSGHQPMLPGRAHVAHTATTRDAAPARIRLPLPYPSARCRCSLTTCRALKGTGRASPAGHRHLLLTPGAGMPPRNPLLRVQPARFGGRLAQAIRGHWGIEPRPLRQSLPQHASRIRQTPASSPGCSFALDLLRANGRPTSAWRPMTMPSHRSCPSARGVLR
jgi:hypothetical protein